MTASLSSAWYILWRRAARRRSAAWRYWIELLRDRANVSSSAVMTIREAVAALWQALSEGHLVALGFDAHDAVVEIPSREWVYLRLREEGERDVLSYDAVGRPEPFTAVTLRQSDVLRLWPADRRNSCLAGNSDRQGRETCRGRDQRYSPR